jgi:hypothetical protein
VGHEVGRELGVRRRRRWLRARGDAHGPVHVYAVRAAKVLAFGKGTFSQTRYR